MKQEIPAAALHEIFYNAMQRARRENRALGLSNITVIDGELVEEKPDGTLVPLGQKAQFGKMISIKKGVYKLKKAI